MGEQEKKIKRRQIYPARFKARETGC